jgi:membrane protein
LIARFWRFFVLLFRRMFYLHSCSTTAAAISFYAILSFIPFVLLAVSILSYFLSSSTTALNEITTFISGNFPVSASSALELFTANFSGKSIYGLLGLIGLLWGSTRAFWALESAMTNIWNSNRQRDYWRSFFVSLAWTPIMIVFLLISLLLTGLLRIAKHSTLPFINISVMKIHFLGAIIGVAAPMFFSTLLFVWVYYLLPNKWNHFINALWGALLASALWEAAKILFDYYVRHFTQLLTVYGSFTSIAILFLWVYYSVFVVLLGAEFGSLMQEIKEGAVDLNRPLAPSKIDTYL